MADAERKLDPEKYSSCEKHGAIVYYPRQRDLDAEKRHPNCRLVIEMPCQTLAYDIFIACPICLQEEKTKLYEMIARGDVLDKDEDGIGYTLPSGESLLFSIGEKPIKGVRGVIPRYSGARYRIHR